ncbi:MAG: Na+-transporting NADH:ubiquinone oxidoreductase subunit A [Candidatus Omnitrophota bacterium]|jgi:Na+-transporting NADH:ubiquinone oxidoreductase subunit A
MEIPHTHIKKGRNLNILGEPLESVQAAPNTGRVALSAQSFPYIKPKLEVAVGDKVKIGQTLFHDKLHPEVKFVSPGAGTVVEINRGERRSLQNIIIELAAKEDSVSHRVLEGADFEGISLDELKSLMLEGGVWPYLRQRPFATLANPSVTPRSIFINGMSTEPLSAKMNVLLLNQKKAFHAGVKAMKRLTEGKVYLSVEKGDIEKIDAFTDLDGVDIHEFSGEHPAGNPSVHILHIERLKKGEVAWTINAVEVALIGRFLLEGKLPVERIIALAGPAVLEPKHYLTRSGASIQDITKDKLTTHELLSYVSGSVLNGFLNSETGYLAYYRCDLTVLAEGKTRELLGWMDPGADKFSFSRSFLSALNPTKPLSVTTNIHGGLRAIVATDVYDKYLPLDIFALPLIKAIIAEDIDTAEKLGLLECVPEDFALASLMCPSKVDVCHIVQTGLEMIKKELE